MFRLTPQPARFSACLVALVSLAIGGTPAVADDPAELLGRLSAFEMTPLALPADRPEQMTVSIPIAGVPHDLTLERVSVWAQGATVFVHRGPGVVEAIDPPVPNTYRGTVAGVPGSSVTGAMKSDGFHAIVRLPEGETWEVAPLDGLGVHAVHRARDYASPPSICTMPDAPDELDVEAFGARAPAGGMAAGSGASTHVAELVVEADREYYEWNGSVDATLDEMALVVNNVNEVYERDVNISHVLTSAIVWTFEEDPYPSGHGGSLLEDFAASLVEHSAGLFDLGLLFTGKDAWKIDDDGNVDYNLAGKAHLGKVCSTASGLASGFVESRFNDTTQAMLAAHELGHVWDAEHCNIDTSCAGNREPCNIMCSTLRGCDDNLAFGPCSVYAITRHRDYRSCLEDGTNGIQWVEWRSCGAGCREDGDFEDPHNTLREAAAESLTGGTIIIKSGSSGQAGGDESFPLVIAKALTIRVFGGSVVIGD